MAAGGGAIVNLGGISSHVGAKGRVHAIAAKSGMVGLTRALAKELAERNITVNTVVPGSIETVRGFAAGGMLTEGAGFFGAGPMRIVGGTVSLGDRGLDPGTPLSGTFAFGIDETSGGFGNAAPRRRPGIASE